MLAMVRLSLSAIQVRIDRLLVRCIVILDRLSRVACQCAALGRIRTLLVRGWLMLNRVPVMVELLQCDRTADVYLRLCLVVAHWVLETA